MKIKQIAKSKTIRKETRRKNNKNKTEEDQQIEMAKEKILGHFHWISKDIL